MRKLLLLLAFIMVSCSDPMSVEIPVRAASRYRDETYLNAVKKLSESDRMKLQGFVALSEMYKIPVDSGTTIGQAISCQEKFIASYGMTE